MSVGQILEKLCVPSRGHIFSPIIMKLCQNVCLSESWTSVKMGHVGSKTRSIGKILEKPCVRSRCHLFNPIIMKLRMFVLMKSQMLSKMGHVGSKPRSQGQIVEKTLCML